MPNLVKELKVEVGSLGGGGGGGGRGQRAPSATRTQKYPVEDFHSSINRPAFDVVMHSNRMTGP